MFRFAPLSTIDVALCFGAGALSITWFEIAKLLGWGGGLAARSEPLRTAATH
jgi:hypothetical protein